MEKGWSEFREKYPEIAERVLNFGLTLYEMGAQKSQCAPELDQLVAELENAPVEAREMLGFNETPLTRGYILMIVFREGSSLLLDYVKRGSCT